jgi:hypothetical protein
LSACDWSSVRFNAKCKESCATVKCDAMERYGNPQVLDRNKTDAGFTCPA